MRTKKGVELSVNTMIIVVIALLVLIILAYMIIKAVGNQTTQTSCEGRGGDCIDLKTSCGDGKVSSPYGGCTKTQRCCVPLGD